MLEVERFDVANCIATPEDVVEYLNVVLGENDPAALTQALRRVARCEGMTGIAEKAGLKREGLCKYLGAGGNPSFATVCKVLAACGLRLQIVREEERENETA